MLRAAGLGLLVAIAVGGLAYAAEPTESDEGAAARSEAEIEAAAYYGPDNRYPDRWTGGWWPPQYGRSDPSWRRPSAPLRPYWYDRSWRRQGRQYGQMRGWQNYGRQFGYGRQQYGGQPRYSEPYQPYGRYNRRYSQHLWRNPPDFASPYAYRNWQNARPWSRYGYAGSQDWR
jgi:hypothetical protein